MLVTTWTPERIAASVPLDDLFTVYGDTSGLVQSHPTLWTRDKHAAKPVTQRS